MSPADLCPETLADARTWTRQRCEAQIAADLAFLRANPTMDGPAVRALFLEIRAVRRALVERATHAR
jgi:hypothetical protein